MFDEITFFDFINLAVAIGFGFEVGKCGAKFFLFLIANGIDRLITWIERKVK